MQEAARAERVVAADLMLEKDAILVPTRFVVHGHNGEEIRHLINAGMTDLEAIEAATAGAPATLGPQAPLSGQLREGFDADVIALDTNPLDDAMVWGVADRVTHVWQSPAGPFHCQCMPLPPASVTAFITPSRLNAAGSWRGGKSLKVCNCSAASAWAG